LSRTTQTNQGDGLAISRASQEIGNDSRKPTKGTFDLLREIRIAKARELRRHATARLKIQRRATLIGYIINQTSILGADDGTEREDRHDAKQSLHHHCWSCWCFLDVCDSF
jgi:hypothetical protein